mgnify:CR=1 FL=1
MKRSTPDRASVRSAVHTSRSTPRCRRSAVYSCPPRGTVPIRAFVFDTYGTVCDFFQPMKRALTALAERQQVGPQHRGHLDLLYENLSPNPH